MSAAQWLVQQGGCSPSDTDKSGATAVHVTAKYGHIRLLKWLVTEADGSITARTHTGAIPLHFAAAAGQLETVKFLVELRPR